MISIWFVSCIPFYIDEIKSSTTIPFHKKCISIYNSATHLNLLHRNYWIKELYLLSVSIEAEKDHLIKSENNKKISFIIYISSWVVY